MRRTVSNQATTRGSAWHSDKKAIHTKPVEHCVEITRHEITDALTPTERAICVLIADGKTNTEIAGTLCIAHGTARNYVSTIMQKLHLPNRAAIATYATVNDLREAVVDDYEHEPVIYNPDCYHDIVFLVYA